MNVELWKERECGIARNNCLNVDEKMWKSGRNGDVEELGKAVRMWMEKM